MIIKFNTLYQAKKFVAHIWNNLEKSTLPVNKANVEAYIFSSYSFNKNEEELIKEAIKEIAQEPQL